MRDISVGVGAVVVLQVLLIVGTLHASAEEITTSICNVDPNKEALVTVDVSKKAFQTYVVPSLTDVSIVHGKSLKKYSLPFKTLWRLMGSAAFIPDSPIPPCEPGCGEPCAPDVDFVKSASSPQSARFTWKLKSKDGQPLVFQNQLGGGMTVNITVPPRLEGTMWVSAAFIDLSFDHKLWGSLQVFGTGQAATVEFFNNPVACSEMTNSWGVLRKPGKSGATPPDVHLRFALTKP